MQSSILDCFSFLCFGLLHKLRCRCRIDVFESQWAEGGGLSVISHCRHRSVHSEHEKAVVRPELEEDL